MNILEDNSNQNKGATIWKNMVKTERKANKRMQKHGFPDNFGSEFIWAAYVIAKHLRRRIESRKLRENIKSLIESENIQEERIFSQGEVEFASMVRKISSMSRSPSRAVLGAPLKLNTPQGTPKKKIPALAS